MISRHLLARAGIYLSGAAYTVIPGCFDQCLFQSIDQGEMMIRKSYKFIIAREIETRDIRAWLFLAIKAAESIYGEASLKRGFSFCLNTEHGVRFVDAGSGIGCVIAKVFAGFLSVAYGESSFALEVTEDTPKPCNNLDCPMRVASL